jgi:uncharacterized ion transporter superfamily protein YfcC
MWGICYFITFLATFIIYVTLYNKTIESEYSLNQSWQKIVEFKLNYFYTNSKSRFNINKMIVIYYVYENHDLNFIPFN